MKTFLNLVTQLPVVLAGDVNLAHDFGRPFNIKAIRLLAFTFGYTKAQENLRGMLSFDFPALPPAARR